MISLVFGRSARRTSSGSTRPRPSTGTIGHFTADASPGACTQFSTAWCSMVERDDMIAWLGNPSENRQIVALGAAAGEDDLRGAASQQSGYRFARVARPPPASPAHDDGWTRRSRSAPQSRAAWPRRPRAGPGWWRCCRGRRGAYRTHFYSTGSACLSRLIRRDVAGYVSRAAITDVAATDVRKRRLYRWSMGT